MKAAEKGHAAVVAHLIKHGADVNHTDNVRSVYVNPTSSKQAIKRTSYCILYIVLTESTHGIVFCGAERSLGYSESVNQARC